MEKCSNLHGDWNREKAETTICRHHITCWITSSRLTICTRRRSCSCVYDKLVCEEYSLKIDEHGKASWTDTGASHRVHKECNRLLHLQWAYNCKRELESRLTPLQIWRTADSTSLALVLQQQLRGHSNYPIA